MKFSTRTRYGLRAMVDIGIHSKQIPLFVKDIARRQNVSERYLENILLTLKKTGILRSIQGGKGGYGFLKKPSEINLREIVEALEGPLSLVECVEKKELCERSGSCVARELWCKVRDEILKILEGITLEELIEKEKEKRKKRVEVSYEI